MAFLNINTNTDSTGLVTLSLLADGQPYTFVIDTGSNVSHLDIRSTVLTAGGTPAGDCTVTGINGEIVCAGKVTQKFSSGIFTFIHEFLLTDLSQVSSAVLKSGGAKIDGILGTDFLTKYRCHLDFKKNRLHLD